MSETMSPPSEFILLWNSMQAMPSPRSTRLAPAFFFTTPFDFFADETDHTPAAVSTGLYSFVRRLKNDLPDAVFAFSVYQLFLPLASSFSTLAATGLPSFF